MLSPASYRKTYHIVNARKFRIMEALFKFHPTALSTVQIARIIGIEEQKVSEALRYYHNLNYKYFRRLKVKDGRAYRYKLNKQGIKCYFEYVKRIKLGIGLNLRKNKIVYLDTYKGHRSVAIKSEKDLEITPEQLLPYIKLTRYGEHEAGVKPEDRLRIVGLVRTDEDKEKLKKLDEEIREGNRGKMKGKEATNSEKTKALVKPVKPLIKKVGANIPTTQDKPVKSSITKPKETVGKPVKEKPARKSKEEGKEKKYVIPDLEEMQVLEIPIKTYTLKNGSTVTSRDLAENVVLGLNDINKRMKKSFDQNTIKMLQDRKRKLLVFLNENRDVAQFIDIQKA